MSIHMRPTDPSAIATRDPIELSSRIIDSGVADEPTNRTVHQLSVIADDIAVIESFSHMYALRTEDGLVCVDASSALTGGSVVASLRTWSSDPVGTLIYSHGHADHVGGSGAVAADAADRGYRRPQVVGHRAVVDRFHRYRTTSGYNAAVNLRQFGAQPPTRPTVDLPMSSTPGDPGPTFLADDVLWPTQTYTEMMTLDIGGLELELHHARGETDDHTWAWIPEHRALCVGDFVIWVFPNAGNPQKVQRYPLEWAQALRQMQAMPAELLLPAHGLPISGHDRIVRVLDDMASVLELLVWSTLNRMNAGQTLDEIVHEVRVPDEMLARPWLRPVYDEPEFVVRNIWRLYGGWWDQDPATLKPAPKPAVAAEVVALAGGVAPVVARALERADAGDLALACHLVEFAVQAEPDDRGAHRARADIYARRRRQELSLMAKGVFGAAAKESTAIVDDG